MSRSKIIKKWLVLKFKRDCLDVVKKKYSDDPTVNSIIVGSTVLLLHTNLCMKVRSLTESKFVSGGISAPVSVNAGERVLTEKELNKIRSYTKV